MVPVDEREIQAHLQAFCPDGFHKFRHCVPAEGGVGGFEIRQGAVEETEAVMVLGGHDHITHARLLCGSGPGCGIKVPGGEVFKERKIFRFRHLFVAADPFAPAGDTVQAPMDEHTEPGPAEPIHPLFISGSVKAVHTEPSQNLFFVL